MIYGILVFLFAIVCILLILIILLQKGKSSMGIGALGGGTQMLFGGSGGQDVFQRATWILGAIFMGGSLIIAMIKKPTKFGILQRVGQQQEAVKKSTIPTDEKEMASKTSQVPAARPAGKEKTTSEVKAATTEDKSKQTK